MTQPSAPSLPPPALSAQEREAERLQELHDLQILDTPTEPQFDRIMRLAARHFGVPSGSITFIDHDRQWFKSTVGFTHREDTLDNSICALAIREPELLVLEDVTLLPQTALMRCVQEEPGIRFYAGAVIRTERGVPLGTICIVDHQPRTFSDEDRRVLTDFAALVSSELRLRRATRHLLEQSRTDDLTGLPNRRALLHHLRAALLRGDADHALALGVFDLDGFKHVNDTQGHAAGDEVLRHVAARTRTLLRPGEHFARFGGDEFAVLLTGAGARERAADLARDLPALFPDGPAPVGLSLGLVHLAPGAARPTPEHVLSAADAAMYAAKARGGGVVEREYREEAPAN